MRITKPSFLVIRKITFFLNKILINKFFISRCRLVGSNICYISPSGATARKSTILSRNLVPKQRFTSESFLKV